MKKKVLVALSGGVDSATAAFLLKQKGYQVVGVTMCLGVSAAGARKPVCCGAQAIADAKRVCEKIAIPHYVLDFSNLLEKKVINKFVAEYQKGRTPNPCVDCNTFLKFEALLNKTISLGFDFLATGHYANIVKIGRQHFLKRSKDKTKDQTYFLYGIKKENLAKIIFPLANLTKEEVRKIAEKNNLPVAKKLESQDICFIPSGDRRKLFEQRIKNIKSGRILDLGGKVLGQHPGVVFYTIGQREGLGISAGRPLYVVAINAPKNQIIVGEKKDLKSKALTAGDLNLFTKKFPEKVLAKIRYAHPEAACKISPVDDKIKVIFDEPQEAITPGQSVVFYDRDLVLGGGTIEAVLKNGNS